jgi:hypothetical protein
MRFRRLTITSVLIIGGAISLYAAYSGGIFKNDFHIETRSPQGTYRLVFEGKADSRNSRSIGSSSERVILTVFKGQSVYFVKTPFFGEDGFDLHFKGAYPVVQWVNNFTLRMGGNLSAQPFVDEIRISNGTKEEFGVVEIFYGRSERFLIFDFEPGAHLVLSASPQFSLSLPPASTVIYKTTNLVTRQEKVRVVEGVKRKSASEGSISTNVEIIDG